jgi:MFS family permease
MGSAVALPILAATEYDDITLGALLSAASLAPSVLAAPVVGAALDRSRRPRTLVLAAAVVTAIGYGLAAAIGPVPIPLVFAALILAGCATPFVFGGLSSFATDEVPDERRAYAYDALAYNVGSVAGPAIVAVAIAIGSARIAMVALTAIVVLGALGLFATRLPARPATDEHPLRSIAVGLRHLVSHRPIALVTLSATLTQIGAGALPVVAVSLAIQRTGQPDPGAWIVTAAAIGGLVGSLLSVARQWTDLSAVVVMAGGYLAIGGLTAVAALDLGIGWTIAVIGASGLFIASTSAAMLLLRKQQSTPRVRSQIFTVGAGLRTTAGAVGAALAGALADLDAATLLVLIGVGWILSALVLIAYPRTTEPLPDS